MRTRLEEELIITGRDLVPLEGVRYYRQRKELFYSLQGNSINLNEVKRCELRHTGLVLANCLTLISYVYGVTKLVELIYS